MPGLGAADATVGGTWQFHTGDDPAWASPTLDDSGWLPISVAKSWGAQTKFRNHFRYDGFAWYRRHIDIPAVAGVLSNLAIYLPRVDDAYEVYWNGALVGSFGTLPPHPMYYYGPPPHTFGLGAARSGVLAIRVKSILTSSLLSLACGLASAQSAIAPVESTMVRSVDTQNRAAAARLEKMVDINSGTMNFVGAAAVKDEIEPRLTSLGFTTRWVPMDQAQRAGDLVADILARWARASAASGCC